MRDRRALCLRAPLQQAQQQQRQAGDRGRFPGETDQGRGGDRHFVLPSSACAINCSSSASSPSLILSCIPSSAAAALVGDPLKKTRTTWLSRSEEHTSELQSLMRISYAG